MVMEQPCLQVITRAINLFFPDRVERQQRYHSLTDTSGQYTDQPRLASWTYNVPPASLEGGISLSQPQRPQDTRTRDGDEGDHHDD